ncbi:MAG: ferritin [Bacteroidales bacterium]
MIKKAVEQALNEQIKREEFSSRLYLAMASWCEVNGFPGAASFLYAQAEEERMHMMKLVNYVNDRGGHALFFGLEQPEHNYESLSAIFKMVMKHEQYITASINDLYDVCMTEKDYTTGNFLQWYINEQIEEESSMSTILDQINLIGKDNTGFFLIDRELGQRKPTAIVGGGE